MGTHTWGRTFLLAHSSSSRELTDRMTLMVSFTGILVCNVPSGCIVSSTVALLQCIVLIEPQRSIKQKNVMHPGAVYVTYFDCKGICSLPEVPLTKTLHTNHIHVIA